MSYDCVSDNGIALVQSDAKACARAGSRGSYKKKKVQPDHESTIKPMISDVGNFCVNRLGSISCV